MSTAIEPFYPTSDLEVAKRALVLACSATKKVRQRNEDTGKIDYVDVPAWEFIIPAATRVIEFGCGKAIARTVNLNLPNSQKDEETDFLTAMATDPEAIAALEDTLSKMKSTAEKLKKGKPLEITVSPVLPQEPKPGA